MDQFIAALITRAAIGVGSHFVPANPTLDLTPTGSTLEQSVPVVDRRVMAVAADRRPVARSRPIASVPGEDVATVREHGYANGLRQDVILRDGAMRGVQNSVTILARTSHQPTLDEQVPLFKPTEPGIRSEIGGQFPHLSMHVSERESSNAYGPYGIALGRGGEDVRCAYMWQWIDANRLPADGGITGPISIRVRLCKAGTTFDAMAAEMDHLTLGGLAPIDQVASNGPIPIIEAPAEARKPAHVHRRPSRRIAVTHRHHAIAARHEAPMIVPVAATGPLYMSSNVGGKPAVAPTMPVAPTAPAQLSGDLPAQAYQGPPASPSTMKTTTAKYY